MGALGRIDSFKQYGFCMQAVCNIIVLISHVKEDLDLRSVDIVALLVNNHQHLWLGGCLAHLVSRNGYSRNLPKALSSLPHQGLIATVASTLSEKVYSAFKRDIIYGILNPGKL